jgi:multidrug efflux system membrane fusion protein
MGHVRESFILKRMLLVTLLSCLALSLACSKKDVAKKAKPPVPVLAVLAERKDVPIELRAIGNVEAYATVYIKSLVAGEITGVNFREGQDVKKGDLLFTIDRRPLEADLKRAESVLSKDMVESANAEVDSARYVDLYKKGMVSRQQYDQVVTTGKSLGQTVEMDKAAVESIKVQLGYTKIYSPIDGRTGNLNANKGNIVKANDTTNLVVINQIRPIYVTFSVPEKFLTGIQQLMNKGRLKVEARINGDTGPASVGILTFVDNGVDVATDTIKLKATFGNADMRLWPGRFVDVDLLLSTRSGVTVVPNSAILTGQKGQYVFVVKPDLTVESRPVVLGVSQEDETVVEQGIKPGEKIVTDGQVRLVPGASVEIKSGL